MSKISFLYKRPVVTSWNVISSLSLFTFSTSYLAIKNKNKKEMMLANQGEATLWDENPMDTAVCGCVWNWSLCNPLLADMHPTKVSFLGMAASENPSFLTVPLPPQLTHFAPLTAALSFIWFLFHLCCNPWDLTLQNVLLVLYLYWCCLVPLSVSPTSILHPFLVPELA